MRRHCLKPVEARLAMFLARGPLANLASFIVWDKADMTSAREGRTVKTKLKYQGFFCKLNHIQNVRTPFCKKSNLRRRDKENH